MGELLRAILKTGGASALSLGLGMVAMKVVALVLGPSGVGFFSILRQTQQIGLTLALLNGQMPVVHGIASRENGERHQYLATVLCIIAAIGTIVGLSFILFGPVLAAWVLNQNEPATVLAIRCLSIPVILGAAHTFLTSVLNGHRAIGQAALVQVLNFGTLAILAYPAAWLARQGYPLAFSGLLTAASLTATALSFWFAFRSGWLSWISGGLRRQFSRMAAGQFLNLAGTMLVTGFLGALIPLAVRAVVTRTFGLESAGILDVAWTLSMAYVTVILASFSSYYLPTLSKTGDRAARVELMGRVLRLALLLMVPLVTSVIALKPLVVKLLYSSEFLPSLHLMRWMLIGDYFKVASWVFSFTMIAYPDMRTFLWTEVIWGAATFAGAVVSVQHFGSIEWIGVNFMLLYLAYLIFTLVYAVRRHRFRVDRPTVLQWVAGLLLIIAVSLHTWNSSKVAPWDAVGWILGGIAFSLLILKVSPPPTGVAEGR